jgi:phosphoribosyl 1,2-cyclic phosphate phosphodiesterase
VIRPTRNRRTRCSILVSKKGASGETRALVDTAPDLREQLLAAKVGRLDGVLITHDHADQTHGMDDLRVLVLAQKGQKIDLWSDRFALDSLERKFSYIFKTPPNRDYPPILTRACAARAVRAVRDHRARRRAAGTGLRPRPWPYPQPGLSLRRGRLFTGRRRAGRQAAFAALDGVTCWIVDALRHRPHPSHAHLDRTLKWIARVKPKRAILTNMHVDMDYDALLRELPPGVEPGYDGMT